MKHSVLTRVFAYFHHIQRMDIDALSHDFYIEIYPQTS